MKRCKLPPPRWQRGKKGGGPEWIAPIAWGLGIALPIVLLMVFLLGR